MQAKAGQPWSPVPQTGPHLGMVIHQPDDFTTWARNGFKKSLGLIIWSYIDQCTLKKRKKRTFVDLIHKGCWCLRAQKHLSAAATYSAQIKSPFQAFLGKIMGTHVVWTKDKKGLNTSNNQALWWDDTSIKVICTTEKCNTHWYFRATYADSKLHLFQGCMRLFFLFF